MTELKKQETKRLIWLDCLRAILIILMVFGHAGSKYITFIYLVHMPGFLVVSGYASFLAEKKETLFSYVRKRVRSILIPAILINVVYIFLDGFAKKCGVYGIVRPGNYISIGVQLKSFFTNLSTTDLGGATWFLFVLFETELLFKLFKNIGSGCRCRWLSYCYFETIASSAKKRKHPLYKWNMSKNQVGRDTAAVSDSQPRALSFLR